MIVLAIDTATPAVTAGVVSRAASGVEVLGERVTVDPRAHAEQLTPNVLGALGRCRPRRWPTSRPSWSVAGQDRSPVCGSAWRPPPPTRTRWHPGARGLQPRRDRRRHHRRRPGGHRRPPPRGVLGALPRRRPRRRARGRTRPPTCRPTPQPSPDRRDHAALFDLPRLAPVARRRPAWCAPSTGRSPPAAAGPAVPAAPRREARRAVAADDRRVRRARHRRRRPLRGAGGASCSPATTRGPRVAFIRELESKHNHYVAARARRRAGRLRGRRPAGPKAAVRVRGSHDRRRPAFPGPGHRPRLLDRLLEIADGGTVFLEVRTDNAAAIALYESVGFVASGCARGTTGSAAPTRTRCRREAP